MIDARSSLRILRRSPGLAISAITALAMGIGFTTTMFSIVHGGTRTLPFANPEELVALTRVSTQGYDVSPSEFDYVEWSRQQQSFDELAAFQSGNMNLAGDGTRPERYTGTTLTPNAFTILGQPPLIGRTLQPGDATPSAQAVVLIGHDAWQFRFGGDSAVVGRAIRVDGTVRTIVGVMPPGFGFPLDSDIWIPLIVDPNAAPTAFGDVTVFGRLRDGIPADQAAAELVTLAGRLAQQYPESHRELSARVMPFVETEMAPNTATILYLMLGVVSFALLIACANVANLLLARAAGRTRDFAIRSALGARRTEIVAQQVLESLVLAACGAVLGVGIAHIGVQYFAAASAGVLRAFWIDFRVDTTVIAFATVLTAVAGVLAGIVPALRATQSNVADVLKDAPGGSTGLRIGRLARSLIVAEVALASGLLIMTMTFTRSAVALHTVEWPFPSRQILTGQLGLLQDALAAPERRTQLVTELTAQVQGIPGVAGVALVSTLPGRGAGSPAFTLDAPATDQSSHTGTTGLALVTPGFLDVLGAGVLRGRDFEWHDGPTAPAVALVNASWVSQYSPDRDPLGRRIWFGDRMLEIVGVVPDLQMQDPEDRVGDGVYASLLQVRPWVMRLMVRTAGDPMALSNVVQDAINVVDPDLPLYEVATLHDAIYADKKVLEAFGTLFLLFGIGALFLTMVGLYGVVAFSVRQRSREIGVRVALGATPRDVVMLVLRQGLPLVGIGSVIGIAVAFGVSQAMAAAIEFVEPAGPLTYLIIMSALGLTALLGLLRPVRRALALEPMTALRME